MILMLNIKHTLMVTAMSLGLVMGGVAVVSAATSATDASTSHVTPAAVTETHVTPTAVTETHVTPTAVTETHATPAAVTETHATPAPVVKVHVTETHDTPVQHQQMNVAQPSEHYNTDMG